MEELMNSFPTQWPFQTTQPILLEYEDSDRKLHLVPLLSLLSALPPPPSSPLLTNHSHLDTIDNSNENSRKYRLPTITIHPAVSKFICRGADLMKSGIRSFPPPWEIRQSKGLVGVTVTGNPQVLAVGFVEKNLFREYCYGKHEDWRVVAISLVGPEKKGVGVTIVSCYGDDLWKSSLPVKAVEFGEVNPLGGGKYDDGNYGNVGFVDGRVACPILAVSEDDSSIDEEGDAVNSVDGCDAQENEDAVTANIEQMNVSDQNEMEETPSASISINDTNIEETTETDHNAILEAAFYTSIIQLLVSKTLLPVPVSTYSAKHLMAAVPPSGPRLDIKQTKHKKIGPFLIEMESHGVIKLGPSKDKKDRCAFLVGIEKQHPDLIAFKRQLKKDMEENGQDIINMAGSTTKKLAVVELYIVPRHISDGMQLQEEDVKAMNAKTKERRGTGFLTKTECRAIIDTYIDSEGLVDSNSKGRILANGPLCDALYRPSKKDKSAHQDTTYPTSVPRKDLIDLWMSKMDAGHALVEMPGSKILNLARGEPKPVDIEVEFRQGNKKKFLTRLRGVEDYGIDAESLSNDVSTRFACSSTLETNPIGRPALRKGRAELVFQGMFDELL
jgi:translation initiation factor 2D